MKSITKIPERSNIEELLNTLTKAQELSWVQLRRYEKKQLNTINQETGSRMKFHVVDPKGNPKKRIQTSSEKIFVLVNDALSGEPSTLDFTMTQDVSAICTNGARISRCMSDYFIFFKRFSEAKSALLLTKCLRQRLWDDSAYQLKQLPGIGMVTAKAFLTAGISNFEKLESADPRHLEQITGRKYPFGDHMKSTLKTLPPKVQMVVRDSGLRIGDKREFLLELTRTESIRGSETGKWYFADMIAGDESEKTLLFHERISPYVVPVYSRNNINVALISEQFVGVDILHKPVPHTSLDESIQSMKPSKAQHQKRKFMDSAGPSPVCSSTQEPESRSKLLSIQKQPPSKDHAVSCIETSTNGVGTTSDFKYGESCTTTAALGEPDHTSASRLNPAGKDIASTFHSTSPRGQDLRSLQSFLADSNMFSDADSFTDNYMTTVGPVPYIPLQPVMKEIPFQHHLDIPPSASAGNRFINGQEHNSLEQEDFGALQFQDNEGDRRKILSGSNSKPVLLSPRGQDLKSLQSFLDDPNTCYDVMSLTDLVVDAPSNQFHLPPEKQQKKETTTMPLSGLATGCTDSGEDKFVDLHRDLELQDVIVEDKFLRPQRFGRTTALRQLLSGSTGGGTTASLNSPDKLTCLDGRTLTDKEIELDSGALQTNQVPSRSSPGCQDQPAADGSAFRSLRAFSSLPDFSLGLPKSPVTRHPVNTTENEATGSCIFNTLLDSGGKGTGNSHSVRDSSDQDEVLLGTKSIFSFLYD
ncbi:hypothetical protein R1sor_001483 [Riccia sorocarpa]|uniref:SEC63 domain-containing protein n=1 Tax=Riccia sorocarpa TaxID=122646 RepID=A0ABD3GY13_9MARC